MARCDKHGIVYSTFFGYCPKCEKEELNTERQRLENDYLREKVRWSKWGVFPGDDRDYDERDNRLRAGCFIATAAYGTPFAYQIDTFRVFRDRVLAKYNIGRAFITFYYHHSPPIAKYISKSNFLRWVVRTSLKPVYYVLKHIGFK